jgi:7-cyano-7-deazaguanine reductase
MGIDDLRSIVEIGCGYLTIQSSIRDVSCGLIFRHTAGYAVTAMRRYSEKHAKSGIDAVLPAVECWENQFPGYEIRIVNPEYTAICPKTGLPDYGTVEIAYVPDQWCLELKSLKEYITAYRNLGIFYENAINRILRDLVAACRPVRMTVRGEFTPRGGLRSMIEAKYERPHGRKK